ncbi:hypothetical protein ACF8OI_00600 [Aeromonas bivalvium]|uniref:hypothetical protein n=1 Tax=Aeromonas bivalvium TaxID=440079 RepID=UPI00370AF40C
MRANLLSASLLCTNLLGLTLLTPTALASPRFELPDYLLQLPRQSYLLMQESFSALYRKTDFTPAITNSYFNYSDLYKFAGLPIAITPQAGFQLEVFGQLYNLASQSYVHMSQDLSLYRMLRADMIGNPNDQIAVGMGLGIPLTPLLTFKALASTNQIPGYGQANYAMGFEWRY